MKLLKLVKRWGARRGHCQLSMQIAWGVAAAQAERTRGSLCKESTLQPHSHATTACCQSRAKLCSECKWERRSQRRGLPPFCKWLHSALRTAQSHSQSRGQPLLRGRLCHLLLELLSAQRAGGGGIHASEGEAEARELSRSPPSLPFCKALGLLPETRYELSNMLRHYFRNQALGIGPHPY